MIYRPEPTKTVGLGVVTVQFMSEQELVNEESAVDMNGVEAKGISNRV
jgi:hypothetical protein